jgi:NTE family protein
MSYPFRNLVFEGGGVKGIAYVGALQVLEDKEILPQIERVGGTSAGAINAVLLSLDFSLDETREILGKLDFRKFLDDDFGVIRDAQRVIDEFGLYKGDFFRGWIGDLIEEKTGNPNSTFNDLRQLGAKDLYLVGVNLSTGFAEVFSAEHTPRMRVVDAVRVSMSIPLFFASVRDGRGDVFVDGGLLDNYPVKLFDREKYVKKSRRAKHTRRPKYYKAANATKPETSSPYVYNKETLGFRLDEQREIAVFRDGAEPQHVEIEDFVDYSVALVKTIMGAQSNQHLHGDDWSRTVYIDTIGVSTVDFGIKDKKKRDLVKEGTRGTKAYFKWYDKADPEDMPHNHPDFRD